MSKERRLGRGLEALLGRAWDDPRVVGRASEHASKSPGDDRISRDENGQLWLNCDAIARNPYQPRQTFDEAEIADLADSIRTHGILQPLVVRRVGDGYRTDRRRAPASAPPRPPTGGRCRCRFATSTIARWPSWPSSKTSNARTSTRSKRPSRSSGTSISINARRKSWPAACRSIARRWPI